VVQKLRISLLSILIVLLLLGISLPGYAQQNISFDSLQIDLWPEYDRPEMLVVYRFQISPNVQLPVNLNIRIPLAAGEPNAVAEYSGGNLLNVDYISQIQGEWIMLQFTATQPEVQIEYYDPSIQVAGIDHTYVYRWPGDYDVTKVVMLVQQPIGAESMQILPPLNTFTPGENGIFYYSGEIGSFEVGETFERRIEFEKDSESLTIEFLEFDSPPINEDTSGRVTLVNIIPWGIGLLGVIVIVGGVYWYWATEKKPISLPKEKSPRGEQAQKVDEKPQRDIYCHQCGKRAEAGDKFCRVCGTKLRV
jgi:hypothetical protein